jgi:hypothetical protein
MRRRKRTRNIVYNSELPTMTSSRSDHRSRDRGTSAVVASLNASKHGYGVTPTTKTRSHSVSSTHVLSPSPLRQVRVTSLYMGNDINTLRYQDTLHGNMQHNNGEVALASGAYKEYLNDPMVNDDMAHRRLILDVREQRIRL